MNNSGTFCEWVLYFYNHWNYPEADPVRKFFFVPLIETSVLLGVLFIYNRYFLPNTGHSTYGIYLKMLHPVMLCLCHGTIVSTLAAVYSVISAVAFVILIPFALFLSKRFPKCYYEPVIKVFLIYFIPAIYISVPTVHKNIRICQINLQFVDEKFLIMVAGWCFKLLCIGDYYKNTTYENIRHDTIDVAFYVAGPSWLSFKDFLSLTNRNPNLNEQWKDALYQTAIKAFACRFLAYTDFSIQSTSRDLVGIAMTIRLIQYRCRYYYLAELAQFQAVAGRLKKRTWMRHRIFDVWHTELSLSLVEALKNANFPVKNIMVRTFANISKVGIFLNILLLLVFIPDAEFIRILLVFIPSIFTQYLAVRHVNEGSRNVTLYRILNNIRMSILFIKYIDVPYTYTIMCTASFIGADFLMLLAAWLYKKVEAWGNN